MAKAIIPKDFNQKATLVYGTYEGKGFWQEQIPIFQAEDEDPFGNPLPEGEEKSAYEVAKEALGFQAQNRRVIIAETKEQVKLLMQQNVAMN